MLSPDILASASKMMAKSFSARPRARAAVSHSLVMAVVGSGTSSRRPMSSACPVPTATTFTAMPVFSVNRGKSKPNSPDCSVEVVAVFGAVWCDKGGGRSLSDVLGRPLEIEVSSGVRR